MCRETCNGQYIYYGNVVFGFLRDVQWLCSPLHPRTSHHHLFPAFSLSPTPFSRLRLPVPYPLSAGFPAVARPPRASYLPNLSTSPALPQSCVRRQISSRLFERCKYYRKRSLARRVMKVESFASVVPLWPTGHCTLLGSTSILAHLPAEKEGAQKSAPERAHERITISLLLFSLENETS